MMMKIVILYIYNMWSLIHCRYDASVLYKTLAGLIIIIIQFISICIFDVPTVGVIVNDLINTVEMSTVSVVKSKPTSV